MLLTRREALLAAAASLAAAGEARTRTRAAAIPVSFWGGWTGPDGLVMQRLVARFNAEVDDVEVTLTLYNWDLIFDRWRQEFYGGSPPDLVGIHASEVAEYAGNGMLREIGAEARRMDLSAGQFLPVVWRKCLVENGLYAVPLDVHPLGLYINARSARRVGLDPSRPPATGAELLSWASRLTSHGRGTWGLAAPAGDVECFRQWYCLLYQYGGQFMDDAGTRCVADSPEGTQAYSFLRDLIVRWRVAMPAEASPDADFLAGRLAMYVQGPWYIRGALQAGIDLVTAPMPRVGRRDLVWANSHVLAVVNTEDATRAAAAMRFIGWLHAHALDWAEAGQVPASNAARSRLSGASVWPYLRPYAAQVSRVVYQPSLPDAAQLFAEQALTPLTSATRAVMLGQETPAQAVRIMSDQVNQALAAPAT